MIFRRIRRQLDNLESFVADVIYDRRKDHHAKLFAGFLKSLSYVFESLVRVRLLLYKNRIFRSQPLGCLVVTVGNLTVGGTGKTPVVEKIARTLTERGRKVAILSRGYKSKEDTLPHKFWRWLTHKDAPPPKVVSDGKKLLLNSEVGGDEPYMLAKNLPGVVVLVDKNRVKAGHYAIKHFGVDTLILDDGFQYLPLKGRLNLLLIDKTNPFGNKRLLPRGILREPIHHLKRASYIFITKSDGQVNQDLLDTIHKYKPKAEIIECTHKPQYLVKVNGQDKLPLSAIKNKRVAALSAIAMPDSFENFLTSLGASVALSQRFIDHHRFEIEELDLFFQQAKESSIEFIITTEKDAVRIPPYFKPNIPLYFLRMEIDILNGENGFAEAISRICFPKQELRAVNQE